MNDDTEYDRLDELLARPALSADRGFAERVVHEARKTNRSRHYLFLGAGISWLLLMLIAASPQAIYADLLTLAQSLESVSLYDLASNQLEFASSTAAQLPYSAATLALLALAALAILAKQVIRA